ncbi:MAG TPA: ShlB/FhaC/HecB family hemolysin secretion/activation protein [Rhizomicrobium sp.]|jgi:hemolysin activation/secretion protein
MRRIGACLALALLGGALLAAPAQADTVSSHALANANQQLLSNLRGLRLVSTPSAIEKDGYARPDVTVEGPYLLYRPGIYERLQSFIGKPLRIGDLSRITAVIADWYKKNNRPFVDVAFPEQDISAGVLQAVVTEFRVGKVEMTGNEWFSSSLLRSQISLKPGDPIDVARLNDDVTRINQSDFRNVTVVTQKSDTPGATDIILQVDDDFPFRFNAGYANNGAPLTGRDRWNIGVTWGNAFWLDQQLSYQFSSNQDFWLHPGKVPVKEGDADFASHSASYIVPFSWHDRLILSGAYSQVRPEIGPDFGEVGVNWQASLRYAIPLAIRGWPAGEIQAGFDFKRSNSDLQFGGVDISNVTTDVDQFTLSYTALLSDAWGQTRLSDRLEISPGNISNGNTDEAFQPSAAHTGTPYAKARYIYNDASAYRLTPLPADFGWITKMEAQWASGVLLPSERLEAGGIETVRGYDEYASSGSEGVLMTQELRSPELKPLHDLISAHIDDQLQFDAFWDFAWLRDQKVAMGDKHSSVLSSVGGGVQYGIGRHFLARLDYGWQLRKAPDATRRGAQIDLSITLNN